MLSTEYAQREKAAKSMTRSQLWVAAKAKAETKGWELIDLIPVAATRGLAPGAYTIVDLKGNFGKGYGVHFYNSTDDAFSLGNYSIQFFDKAREVAVERAGDRAIG